MCLCGLWPAGPAHASTTDEFTFFEGTQYPLTVYYVTGDMPGPTVMVQGGIQGDEISGFITAQLLTRARVQQGNLIIVPRANVPSINLRRRQVNVDMNRRFDRDYNNFYEDRVARAIRHLLGLSDAFVHLHEGSGFYRPKWVDNLRNPNRYGQSIIVDADGYGDVDLKATVGRVITRLNARIPNNDFHFHYFNTETFREDTDYPEMRKSLTCYALSALRIPAVAVEVSKDITQLGWKVARHLEATVLLLEQFGVHAKMPEVTEKEIHELYRDRPVVLVNGRELERGSVLEVAPGATLSFQSRGASLDKTLAVFASDRPGVNLLDAQRMVLEPFNQLEIRADGEPVLDARVRWTDPMPRSADSAAPVFVVWLNGQPVFVPHGQSLQAVEGDQLILEGVWGSRHKEILNLKGFVAKPWENDGQDMGWEIVLDPDNFMDKYRVDAAPEGISRYKVARETSGAGRAYFYVDIAPRRVLAVRLADDHGQTLLVPWHPGGDYPLPPGRYTFLDSWSNGPDEKILPMAGERPVKRGKQFEVQLDQPVQMTMRLSTTFLPLSSMTFKASNLAEHQTLRTHPVN